MPIYRVEPTVKKEWIMELMFQTEELQFWIVEKYRWGYVSLEAKDEDEVKTIIQYSPAKTVNGTQYDPMCTFEDWWDTDNDDLFSTSIEGCEDCNAEDLEEEFEANNWSWDYMKA